MSGGPWLDLCSAWGRLAWSNDPCRRGLSCGGVGFSVGWGLKIAPLPCAASGWPVRAFDLAEKGFFGRLCRA